MIQPELNLVLLLDGRLDEGQVLAQDALESAEGPGIGGCLLLVLIRARFDVGLHGGLVLRGLSQLGHQVVNVEALGVVEELELEEDAVDVAASDLVVRILECPVLGGQSLGHLAGGAALLASGLQVFDGADLVIGSRGLSLERGGHYFGLRTVLILPRNSPGRGGRTAGWQRHSSY